MAMNAIDLLSSDHRQIGELLTELAATTRADAARRTERVAARLEQRRRELDELL